MRPAIATLLAATFCTASHAQINKCPGPDGRTVYQDTPCAAGGERMNIRQPSAQPAAPEAPTRPTAPSQAGASAPAKPLPGDERAAQVAALRAKEADLKYRDCTNRKALLQQEAILYKSGLGAHPEAGRQQLERMRNIASGLPDDCETLRPK